MSLRLLSWCGEWGSSLGIPSMPWVEKWRCLLALRTRSHGRDHPLAWSFRCWRLLHFALVDSYRLVSRCLCLQHLVCTWGFWRFTRNQTITQLRWSVLWAYRSFDPDILLFGCSGCDIFPRMDSIWIVSKRSFPVKNELFVLEVVWVVWCWCTLLLVFDLLTRLPR